MSQIQRENPPTLNTRDGLRPRSPAEALEPGRAPARPRGVRVRSESKAVSGLVRFLSGVMTIFLFVMVLGGGTLLLLYHLYERPGPLSIAQTVVIPKGEGRTEIADRLEREGIISSRWTFVASYLAQRWFGGRGAVELKAGEYEIKKAASMREVLDVLAEGKSVSYKVTIPEGLTSQQIIERLRVDTTLTGDTADIPAEGSLAPETYGVSKGSDRQDMVQRMQAAQAKTLETAWEKRQQGLPLESKEQALVLASIVEKETGRADERDKVAAVFVNRLRKGMPLQSDPTILYGLYGGAVQWGKPILQSEKDAKNAHNTYQFKGLPPTPICNPGRAAIEAVLNPAKTNDLYFVADGNGGHTFSDTLKEHNQAVATWRKVEKDIRAKQDGKEGEGTAPEQPATQRAVLKSVPAAATTAIPNPPAEPTPAPQKTTSAAPAAGASPSAETSTIPLPVRKPKK